VLAESPESEADATIEPASDADAESESDGAGRSEGDDGKPAADDGQTEADEPAQPENPGSDDDRARMEAFRRAILGVDPENGAAVVERLRRAGITDLESLIELDPEAIAAELSLPVEQIVALQERLGGRGEPIALEDVNGIGPTYAGRLREKGVRNVSQLAALDPETVAEITKASASRAEGWIAEAKRMAEER